MDLMDPGSGSKGEIEVGEDRKYMILTINPGSTSTKIAVFENEKELFGETLRHSAEELGVFDSIADQWDFRRGLVLDALREHGVEADEMDAF